MSAVENPPAFPFAAEYGHPAACGGMSLRDWFAGQVASQFLAQPNGADNYCQIAAGAYAFADAMLLARSTPKDAAL